MGEGARDTGFMLEWMLFPERLQEHCTICYFLKTAGEKTEHAESLRTEPNMRLCSISVFALSFLSVSTHVRPVAALRLLYS